MYIFGKTYSMIMLHAPKIQKYSSKQELNSTSNLRYHDIVKNKLSIEDKIFYKLKWIPI